MVFSNRADSGVRGKACQERQDVNPSPKEWIGHGTGRIPWTDAEKPHSSLACRHMVTIGDGQHVLLGTQ